MSLRKSYESAAGPAHSTKLTSPTRFFDHSRPATITSASSFLESELRQIASSSRTSAEIASSWPTFIRSFSPPTWPTIINGQFFREAILAIALRDEAGKLMIIRDGDSLKRMLNGGSGPGRPSAGVSGSEMLAPMASRFREENQHSARATASPPSEQS